LRIHLFEETVLDELDLVTGADYQIDVFPLVDELEGLLCYMFEYISEEDEILVQNLLVYRHLGEFVEHQTNIDVQLPVDAVGVEKSGHLLKNRSVTVQLKTYLL